MPSAEMRTVDIKVYGTDPIEASFLETARRAEDVSPLAAEIFARFEEITEDQFRTRGARAGRVWRDLSYEWAKRKFEMGRSVETLKETTLMYQSLTQETSDSVRIATRSSFEFGSTRDTFNYHQDPNIDAEYPIRKPIDLTRADELKFTYLIQAYVVGEVNRIGQFTDPDTSRYLGGSL